MILINVVEMSQKIKTTVGTVYAWVSMKRIPHWCIVKVGRSLKFDEMAVEKWLNGCRLAPIPADH